MFFRKYCAVIVIGICPFLSGCMISYLAKSGYHQVKILNNREPIGVLLADPQFPEDKKAKLKLAQAARVFAEKEMHLKSTDNYTTYVELDRPYVSYIVQVAKIYELEPYLWSFPLVGRLPYKGFFNPKDAEAEAKKFSPEKYDTYVRGVSAYSTLGWFDDPILSSMLRYEDHELVNLIIHESVHATVYIKSHADFNEQLATFLGDLGTTQFYTKMEGPNSPTVTKIKLENADQKIFSQFITSELKALKQWYKDNQKSMSAEKKKARLKEIQNRFSQDIAPRLKTDSYKRFAELDLNNAILLSYQTYVQDLDLFDRLLKKLDGDLKKFVQFCRALEKSKDPKKEVLKQLGS